MRFAACSTPACSHIITARTAIAFASAIRLPAARRLTVSTRAMTEALRRIVFVLTLVPCAFLMVLFTIPVLVAASVAWLIAGPNNDRALRWIDQTPAGFFGDLPEKILGRPLI